MLLKLSTCYGSLFFSWEHKIAIWFKTTILYQGGTADVVGLGVILISIYEAIEKSHYAINIFN